MIYTNSKPDGLKALVQSSLMGEHLIRLARLRAYQKLKGWDDAELARQIGRTQQQVHSWVKDRLIGEKLARGLEEALGLPRFWLDERENIPLEAALAQPPPRFRLVANGLEAVKRGPRPLPVVPWEDLLAMLELNNTAHAADAPHLDSHAVASQRAKFVQLIDDAMAPTLVTGDHVLLDPAEVPRAGDVVLVRLPSGEHFVRSFRPRTAYVFDAVAANPHYQPISSAADGAHVVAVMVEHRSYRRAL